MMWLRHGSMLFMTGMLWGCAMVNGSPPAGSAPLFQADESDTAILQAIQREQDTLLSTCAQHQSCDQVHFTRAMVALFKNNEEATASFQQAIAVAPTGPLAESSANWVRLLTRRTFSPRPVDRPAQAALEVMQGLVRTWLEQQHATHVSSTSRAAKKVQHPDKAVFSLQRKIRNRDKRIAELTEQLGALKQIDLDANRKNTRGLPRTPSK